MEGLCNLGANRMMKWILKPESEYLENKHWREKKDKIKRGRGAQRALIPQDSPWAQCENHSAAAAKSLQSCPTPCDPIDSSPPGSPIPGILQARTLEWLAISFSNAWKWKVKVKLLSLVRLLATPWSFWGVFIFQHGAGNLWQLPVTSHFAPLLGPLSLLGIHSHLPFSLASVSSDWLQLIFSG